MCCKDQSSREDIESLRMTEKSRLATAAPAIVQRMISRSRPLVFRPESPFKKGSKASIIIADVSTAIA